MQNFPDDGDLNLSIMAPHPGHCCTAALLLGRRATALPSGQEHTPDASTCREGAGRMEHAE